MKKSYLIGFITINYYFFTSRWINSNKIFAVKAKYIGVIIVIKIIAERRSVFVKTLIG